MFLERYKETFTLPFKEEIPNNLDAYIDEIYKFKRLFKFLKRYLFLFFNFQLILERNQIKSSDKKILWINISAPSIGDSLMDLSPRVLFGSKQVDLLTDKKNAFLYFEDKHFRKVYTEKDLIHKKYDLIILDSYSSRTMSLKLRMFRNTPFVSMFGFYNGPEINRILFAFYRINQLFGDIYSSNKIKAISNIQLNISNDYSLDDMIPENFISIAIGGAWSYRTYPFWGKVIHKIFEKYKDLSIILVGSENGNQEALKIISVFKNNRIKNFVNKLSFSETIHVIKKSKVFLCADGGLMHAYNSFQRPVISIFARVEPEFRITDSMKVLSLYDKDNVKNVQPDDVFEKFEEALKNNI